MTAADPRAWVGRFEERDDVAEPGPVRRLAALLDHTAPPWRAGIVPPLGHWLYFLPEARQSAIGADGHPRPGGFLPPIDLPRRMWAGGRIEFRAPIALGAKMTRRSTVADVVAKTGASGAMVFVIVRHEIVVEGVTALVEEQDIVYRAAASPPAAPRSAPGGAEPEWRRSIALGPVALFGYSALTFNGHRIHYDRDYARNQENYPGLVVHGPYIATLLVDNFLRWRPQTPIAKLAYRARSPLFDGRSFDLCAVSNENGARLWAQEPGRPIAMEAEAAGPQAPPT
jgi:3-methylfumaryl-CoA hydratase